MSLRSACTSLPLLPAGVKLRQLFRLDGPAVGPAMQLAQRNQPVPAHDARAALGAPWADIVISFMAAVVLAQKGDNVGACKEFRDRFAKGLIDQVRRCVPRAMALDWSVRGGRRGVGGADQVRGLSLLQSAHCGVVDSRLPPQS